MLFWHCKKVLIQRGGTADLQSSLRCHLTIATPLRKTSTDSGQIAYSCLKELEGTGRLQPLAYKPTP